MWLLSPFSNKIHRIQVRKLYEKFNRNLRHFFWYNNSKNLHWSYLLKNLSLFQCLALTKEYEWLIQICLFLFCFALANQPTIHTHKYIYAHTGSARKGGNYYDSNDISDDDPENVGKRKGMKNLTNYFFFYFFFRNSSFIVWRTQKYKKLSHEKKQN
jgi:hypothetical protein